MAIMIPEVAREYDPASLEGVMFDSLKKLSSDYYVVHSFKNVYVENNTLHEGEVDFVIFNQTKGLLCLEAKAGAVRYEGGYWKYASGCIMKHGGPYNQAALNKWDLLSVVQNSSLKDVSCRCKFLHAVWFPSISQDQLRGIKFPKEADRTITLTKEALEDPETYISSLFDIELENHIKTDLSERDVKRLIREIICPEFNIFPSKSFDNDLKKIVFHRLLKEQEVLLNYLVEQKSAVINGAAGTGKTMMAVEKATRHASNGERVLFLCYNVMLRDYLDKEYHHEYIDYMTIDKFACKVAKTEKPDYRAAGIRILDMYLSGSFRYKHVIIDEGQDFGREQIEEAELLQTIYDVVIDNEEARGTFYVFYDKLQLVQSKNIPKFISDADCKLTLYKNCRNTENIAITSLKAISDRNPKLCDGAIKGVPARIHYQENSEEVINRVASIIEELKEEGITDVAILTCKSEAGSILNNACTNGTFRKKIFTTCRKYKGLEADAIILVDVDEETFRSEAVQRFYVGSSRARLRLEIVTTMTDTACENVLLNVVDYKKKIKNPKRDMASAFNSMPIV
jgi:nuclease-related domain protein